MFLKICTFPKFFMVLKADNEPAKWLFLPEKGVFCDAILFVDSVSE